MILEIRDKLVEKLRESGWTDKLKGFLLSEDFLKILEFLRIERFENGKRFTPPLKYLLRAFEECKYKDLRVVIIGQD